ncbi:MAG: ribonuclease HII [Blautia sp.]|nr:ribonuclease HII [Blautia sp.]
MKTIKQIQQEFAAASPESRKELAAQYRDDTRTGVLRLIEKYQKEEEAKAKEQRRLENMRVFEKEYAGMGWICGIDEAGRGPLAGPVVAAAVILPEDCLILHLDDSKKLTPKRRDELFDVIKEKALGFGIGQASHTRIDEINILQATYEAMRMAVAQLPLKPAVSLNDAVTIPGLDLFQVPIIKGDQKSVSIAAASILAKVSRDRMMEEYDRLYPGYGFAVHKGYGTTEHMAAIQRLGPCPIHRRSFLKFLPGQEEN